MSNKVNSELKFLQGLFRLNELAVEDEIATDEDLDNLIKKANQKINNFNK